MPTRFLKIPGLERTLFLVTLVAVLVSSCFGSGNTGGQQASAGLAVVVTTTQIGDFTAEVGGDLISLTVLLRPNQDAHDFEPEPSALRALAAAELILRNGLELDNFVSKAIDQADAPIVVVTGGITLRRSPEDTDADPHVWHSVSNAIRMVENIRDALIEADQRNAATYETNARLYIGELAALEDEIETAVATLPATCRKLISNHDVFGYFADAYGFEFVASLIPSTSSAAQASAADVAKLVEKIRESGVPAIFSEASANSGLIRQAAREAQVALIDDLYGDSLGLAESGGATYVGMMRWNTTRIVAALGACDN